MRNLTLDRALLKQADENIEFRNEFHACTNAHGLYSTLQFVLRLSPAIHKALASTPTGIYSSSQISFEQVQAFSTYLHETIHWWQHIGSTAGLLLSLSHPVQTHANYSHLKMFLREVGPKKSILKYSQSLLSKDNVSSEALQATNIIVNNFKDVGFFQAIALDPSRLRQIGRDPYFENVAHSYYITYANTLRQLTHLFDRDFSFLEDPRAWEPAFNRLKENKEEGFYYGSPVAIPPLGLRKILEGQARFIQLQYLHFGSGGRFGWEDARDMGMFGDVYISAFKEFLSFTASEWPDSIDSALVGLFLAVCDVAINSGEGFPLPLKSPHSFISDNDPGTRFVFLCRLIALKAPHLKTIVQTYSKDEYLQVTEDMSKLMFTPSPHTIATVLTDWSRSHQPIIDLMEEDRVFRFKPIDMPARLLFARYINFNRDKVERPEMFCWPGAWMAGDRVTSDAEAIFDRHRALFVDKENDNGIFPALLTGKDETNVHETFQDFYGWIVNYDLTTQWMVGEGKFSYNFGWLSVTNDSSEVQEWAARRFEHVFGIHPNNFQIL